MSVAGYVKRLTQLSAYGTCTAVRNALGCQPGGIIFTERTVNLRLWGACFILRLVGAFMGSNFCEKFWVRDTPGHCEFHSVDCRVGVLAGHCRGAAGVWSGCRRGGMSHPERAPSRRRQPGVILGHKERGGPHTQRPTPHVPGTVISAASHRYPEFHGRCRRDEESSTTLWCLSARLSR